MTLTEEDVQARLGRWARYVAGSLNGGFLGLPGHCTYLEFAIKSTGRGSREVPSEVWETDKAIRTLGEQYPHLRLAIEVSYLGQGNRPEQASMMKVSERTRDRWVQRAVQYLLADFNSRK